MRIGRQRDIDHSEGGHVTTPAGTPIHPQFRVIDELSICFTESERQNDDALPLSPWPESIFALEPIWAPPARSCPSGGDRPAGFRHSERRNDVLSPATMGELALPHAEATLRFSDGARPRC
jgi:hypothetical protein